MTIVRMATGCGVETGVVILSQPDPDIDDTLKDRFGEMAEWPKAPDC